LLTQTARASVIGAVHYMSVEATLRFAPSLVAPRYPTCCIDWDDAARLAGIETGATHKRGKMKRTAAESTLNGANVVRLVRARCSFKNI